MAWFCKWFGDMIAAVQRHYAALWPLWTQIKAVGLKKSANTIVNAIKNECGVTSFGELVRFLIKDTFNSVVVLTGQKLFEFAVKYTFTRFAQWITPSLFIQTQSPCTKRIDYFSALMSRYPYADCADIILYALKYAPNDLQSDIFIKSLNNKSRYYTEKLIPPEVDNRVIVTLIQQNNMPVLAQVLNDTNLNFMVAAAAVLEHDKLIQTFENRMNLSQVVKFIDSENWRNHGIYLNNDEKSHLVSVYQNKMLMRQIDGVTHSPTQRRKM